MSITDHKHMSEVDPAAGRRLEIFTGAGRRRSWSTDEKAAIVAESYAGKTSVCDVARRHGLTPSQLFTWRREARRSSDMSSGRLFVEAIVDPVSAREEPVRRSASENDGLSVQVGLIEVEIDGATVRVGRGAEAKTIAAVLRALKRTS